MIMFSDIENRIKEVFNISKNTEIADLLGVTSGRYGNWKKRESIPYSEIISLCLSKDIDMKYILTGEKSNKSTIKNINFKEEIHKMIDELEEKKAEVYYHLIKAELLKEKL